MEQLESDLARSEKITKAYQEKQRTLKSDLAEANNRVNTLIDSQKHFGGAHNGYTHDTFPVSRLKRASAVEFSNMDETAPPVLEDEDSAYDVASILDHDDRQDGRYYLIQWKGVQPLHHYRAHGNHDPTLTEHQLYAMHTKDHILCRPKQNQNELQATTLQTPNARQRPKVMLRKHAADRASHPQVML